MGYQRRSSRRVARPSCLPISDYRLPAVIDVDVLDADILVSAVAEAAKGLHLHRIGPHQSSRGRCERHHRHGHHACVAVCIGVGKRPNIFGAAEIAQAESFRDQALIAIENARLFESDDAGADGIARAADGNVGGARKEPALSTAAPRHPIVRTEMQVADAHGDHIPNTRDSLAFFRLR